MHLCMELTNILYLIFHEGTNSSATEISVFINFAYLFLQVQRHFCSWKTTSDFTPSIVGARKFMLQKLQFLQMSNIP